MREEASFDITKSEALTLVRAVVLSRSSAETIIQALSARATDAMRFEAWELLDEAIRARADRCKNIGE